MYLFFDTETTGLPKNFQAPYTETSNWPRIVQLAYLLVDEQGSVVEENNQVIKPEGYSIPLESTRVHGITTAYAKEHGVALTEVLSAFFNACRQADTLVAHNISFDRNVLAAACVRTQNDTDWLSTNQLCTMVASTNYCKIPNPYREGYRWPKLEVLHTKLFGESFSGAHDALADVRACKRCFFELQQRGVLKTQKL